jgi:hypothetical protein
MVLGSMACAALAQDQAKPAQSPEAELERQYAPGHPALIAAKQMRAVEEELRKQLAAAEIELREIRAKMRAVNGGRPVEGLRETASQLQRDATRLRIDMAGMNARKEVVAQAIDEGRKSAAEQSERDPVATQLKEVIRLLEDSAKQTKEAFNAGATAPTEMRRAEVDLAGAKVKLLERQQTVAQQSGGADVARLAEQLRDLSASLVETRARLEATDEVLATHERVQEILEQEEAARRQIDKLRGMIEHVEKVKLDRRLGVPAEGRN